MDLEPLRILRASMDAFAVPVTEADGPEALSRILQRGLNGPDMQALPASGIDGTVASLTKRELLRIDASCGLNIAVLYLPDASAEEDTKRIAIGPWRHRRLSHEEGGQLLRLFGIRTASAVEEWLLTQPLVMEPVFSRVLQNILDLIFSPEGFITRETSLVAPAAPAKEAVFSDDLFWQSLSEGFTEKRYEAENAFLNAVAAGNSREAAEAFLRFRSFDQRGRFSGSPEKCRHGVIILNTLLRKAIEQAGVHPYYLDEISADFAGRIPEVATTEQKQALQLEMIAEYARYAREYALRSYSPIVRRTIQFIRAHLGEDLSLAHLAEVSQISQSYLSSLFSRETGTTLTNYIMQQRAYRASQLLRETDLSIAETAAEVGMFDVNYFTKVFRKVFETTPTRYRLAARKKEDRA